MTRIRRLDSLSRRRGAADTVTTRAPKAGRRPALEARTGFEPVDDDFAGRRAEQGSDELIGVTAAKTVRSMNPDEGSGGDETGVFGSDCTKCTKAGLAVADALRRLDAGDVEVTHKLLERLLVQLKDEQ